MGFTFTINTDGHVEFSQGLGSIGSESGFFKNYERLKEQQRLSQQFETLNYAEKLQALRQALNNAPIKQPDKPISKADRIKQIEHELDICKGIIPTPKGYKIDKANIKRLVVELKKLRHET